ncbi:MAG: dsbD [Deltaproteobacteria bacterium]|nr:dsbD [Deltaproteobacteria bacterium]
MQEWSPCACIFPVQAPHRIGIAIFLLLMSASMAAPVGRVGLHLQLQGGAAVRGAPTKLEIRADVEPGWHINAHQPTETFLIPTELRLAAPPGVAVAPPTYPRPERRAFAFAGGKELLVYEGGVGMATALSVPADFTSSTVRIIATLRYQACNDVTCLPPATANAELVVPVTATAEAARPVPVVEARPEAQAGGGGVDVGAWIGEHGLGVTLLLVALLGLGLNLTPCVYPLISVTVAYFGVQGRQRHTPVALLAATYVLGIIVSFATLGVAAALSGGLFGEALQKPPVLVLIAAVLVMLALSSFGLYQLQPPAWALRYVSGAVQGVFGSFFMGLTMGVVAAPCVGPVVIGLLLFVGTQQSGVLGLELFCALGLGMGLPYLGLAMAAGSIKALPRSGEWLVWVERVFGVLLLAMAAYFTAPLMPPAASRLVLPGLAAAGGLYLGFVDRSGAGMRYFPAFKRLAGLAALLLAAWTVMPRQAESAIAWQPFDVASLDAARRDGRPVVVDFVADWCLPCREMDETTFVHADVRQQAERFAMFKADITHDSENSSALVERYQVRGVPTLILFDGAGTEVKRLVGFVGGRELAAAMRDVR